MLCGVSLPVRDSPSLLPLLRCYFIYSLSHLEAGQVFSHKELSEFRALQGCHCSMRCLHTALVFAHHLLMDGYRPQVLHQYLRNAQNSSELLFVFPPHLSEDTVKSNKLVISSPPTQGKEKSEVKRSISKAVHFNSFKNKSEKGP